MFVFQYCLTLILSTLLYTGWFYLKISQNDIKMGGLALKVTVQRSMRKSVSWGSKQEEFWHSNLTKLFQMQSRLWQLPGHCFPSSISIISWILEKGTSRVPVTTTLRFTGPINVSCCCCCCKRVNEHFTMSLLEMHLPPFKGSPVWIEPPERSG